MNLSPSARAYKAMSCRQAITTKLLAIALTDPRHWRKKALSLRICGDATWDEWGAQMKLSFDPETKTTDDDKFEAAFSVLLNSQFLYALAAECGLKGLLISAQPELVQITTISDASGNVSSVEITRKGGFQFNTHNLESLAEKTGILSEPEFHDMREILAYATDVITWRGRYPVPLAHDSDFKRRGTIPTRGFAHFFRDWFDPFLDGILARIDANS